MHLTKLTDKRFTSLSGVEYEVGVGQNLLKEHSLYIGSRVETVRGVGVIVGLVDSNIYVYLIESESQGNINAATTDQSEKNNSNHSKSKNNESNKMCIEAIAFSETDLGTPVIRATNNNFTVIKSNTECSTEDHSIKSDAMQSHKGTTTPTPINANVTHRVKKIVLHGKCITIVTQEKHGPCPVIALANALALQGEISLSSYTYQITAKELRSIIASYLWSGKQRVPRFVFKPKLSHELEERKNEKEHQNNYCKEEEEQQQESDGEENKVVEENQNNKCCEDDDCCENEKKYKNVQELHNDESNPLDVSGSKEQREKGQRTLREAVQDADSFNAIRRKLIGEHEHTFTAETTLQKLYTGLEIDPIFSDVEAFALTDEAVALFALAGVRLVHGWVMSPSMEFNFDANEKYKYNNNSGSSYFINNSTIDQENTKLSNFTLESSSNGMSDTNTISSAINWLRHLSFIELTTLLATSSSSRNTVISSHDGNTTPLTSSSFKRAFSSVSERVKSTLDRQRTNASMCEDASCTDEDSENNKKFNNEDDGFNSRCKVDYTILHTRRKLANEFYQITFATQMTQYGASMLSDAISENEVVVLYWRYHFFTLIKVQGRLLTLCSNENFVDKPSFVFSVLDTQLLEENAFADGDGNDVDGVLCYVQANVGNLFTEEEIHAAHAVLIKQHFQSATCLTDKEETASASAPAPCVKPEDVLEYLQAKRKNATANKYNTALMHTSKYPEYDNASHNNNAFTDESSSSLAITSSSPTTNVSDSAAHENSSSNTCDSESKHNNNAKRESMELVMPAQTWCEAGGPCANALNNESESINANMFDTHTSTLTTEEKTNDLVLQFMEVFPDIPRTVALQFIQENNNNIATAIDAYCSRC